MEEVHLTLRGFGGRTPWQFEDNDELRNLDKAVEVVKLLSHDHWTSTCIITMSNFKRTDQETPIPTPAENVEKVKEHMMDEELEQLLEGTENVNVDEFAKDIFNDQEEPDNRIDPGSYKESPEAKKSDDDVTITNDDVEEESAGDESPRTHIAYLSPDKETLQELMVTTEYAHSFADKEKLHELTIIDTTPSSSSLKPNTGSLLNIYNQPLAKVLPSMVGDRVNEIAKKTVPLYVAEGLLLDRQKTQADVDTMIVEAVQKEHENLRADISLQDTNTITNSISPQMKDDEKLRNNDLSIWWSLKIKFDKHAPSTTPCRTAAIRPGDHDDDHDDAHPEGENSAKRQKMSEHGTYTVGESSLKQHKDQEPNPSDLEVGNVAFTNSKDSCNLSKMPKRSKSSTNYFVESILVLSQAWQLKNKEVYSVTTQNLWAKQDHIRRQKELRDKPEEVYSRSKIVEVIRTSYELGHEHKFITEIVVRRANGKIDPIKESDYKYLNKNDIEGLYLLCINGKVKDYKETGLLGSLSVFIRSTVI
ncbi:hypothetical protein Tco_0096999 [Tanacetum coccineum]